MTAIRNTLREQRQLQGLSQQELANRVGISRQALCSIESGAAVPGTDVTLRLAQVLGLRVESLFRLEADSPAVEAELAAGAPPLSAGEAARVLLADVDGRWIAHPLDPRQRDSGLQAADGLATATRRRARVKVEPLSGLDAARERLVIMGCAPALGLLAARLAGEPGGVKVSWLRGASAAALTALRRGEVHLAGIHLLDEASGEYNAPFARRQFPERPMLLVNLASWEQGIVVAAGNPLGLKTAGDLLRPLLRFVAREPGAGANKLLERALRPYGVKAEALTKQARVARGHMEVAEAIALGTADAGIAIRSAALAWGLDFIPLAEERFDLVVPRELAVDPRVERLVDVLGSRGFRRELDAVGGYLSAETGRQVAQTRCG